VILDLQFSLAGHVVMRHDQSKITNPKSKSEAGPELLGEILSRLFTARGWGRRQDRLRLEQAWAESVAACGLTADQTRVGGLRRGVLEVLVGNAVLLQELAHFYKRRLLEEVRSRLPGTTLTDLRFRAGVVTED
jgi:predicted nucleic acid-binding Zn ribbon protein